MHQGASPIGSSRNFRLSQGVQRLLLSYFIVSIVYTLGIELYGPFLRSLVTCDIAAADATTFSGSSRCGDAAFVLATAQAEEGYLVSMKLAVHAVAGPFLGSLADQMGRKPMLLLSLGGFFVAFVLFTIVATEGLRSFTVLAMCFLLEGATNAFGVVYKSMLADLVSAKDQAAVFTAYEICGAVGTVIGQLTSVGILKMFLTSYRTVWLILSAVLLGDVLFVWAATEETLSQPTARKVRGVRGTAAAVFRAPFELVTSDRFLRCWLMSGGLTTLAAGQSGILAAFSIAVYGWRPGAYQASTWFKQLLRAASLMIVGPFAKELPAAIVILADIVASAATQLPRILAPFSPLFLLWPVYAADALAFTQPSQDAFLNSKFPAEKRGTVIAVQHFCSNLCASLSMALFSSPLLFSPEARRWQAARPFLLASALTVAGGLLKATLVSKDLRKVFRSEADHPWTV